MIPERAAAMMDLAQSKMREVDARPCDMSDPAEIYLRASLQAAVEYARYIMHSPSDRFAKRRGHGVSTAARRRHRRRSRRSTIHLALFFTWEAVAQQASDVLNAATA